MALSIVGEMQITHEPVMLKEVLEFLNLRPGMRVLDGTVGAGGHAKEILRRIGPEGVYVGIDQDPNILEIARENLGEASGLYLVHENFLRADRALQRIGMDTLDACLLDLGVSSHQLETAERGFSFQKEGLLDMRMDPTAAVSAFDLVNHLSEWEIVSILQRLGQERYARRIAHLLVQTRQKEPVRTTRQLAGIVERAIPHHGWNRIHPATRTFQAFRMAVNRELESLEEALPGIVRFLKPGGRICVISFHSLEDRVVKLFFRRLAAEGQLKLTIKKPLAPSPAEVHGNPRARSAKLRVAEKC
ncbi:MAG: 16S rRNA (cytosine(1402)-N(4))-methyltransferase RsmH [Candidatus Omnitrophica bacterium]|nr:16S rRNA (cytosine(1402)-N(4))-methyltransferase RsmH [Candidatus Omnitrophota bacterium]